MIPKILIISPALPSKSGGGFQVLSFHRIMSLSLKSKICILCFDNYKYDQVSYNMLVSRGVEIIFVKFKYGTALLSLIKGFITIKPLQCSFYQSNEFRKAVKNNIENFNPDYIYAITIRVMTNIDGFVKPVILEMVDSLGLNFKNRIASSGIIKKLLYLIESKNVLKFERICSQNACNSFLVSDIDKNYIGNSSIHVLPLGVDIELFGNASNKFRKNLPPIDIIFTGNMYYGPNIEAVMWFYNNCWKKIRSEFRSATFSIVGSRPANIIKSLNGIDGITVHGRVDSIADFISAAKISVAPMVSGSGMQFKILEAMASYKPVIATTLGLGDIKALIGQDILVADNPSDFANVVIKILRDHKLADEIGENARKFVVRNHSWDAINSEFIRLVKL
jgi:glycosyltransferase involved in cell wall biosynthesis